MSITGILLKAFEGAFNDRLKGICLIFLSFIINGAITNAERHTQMPSWVRSLFDFILIKKPSLPENVGLIPQDTVGRESGRQQQGGPNQHHDQNNQQQQESRQHQQGVQHGSHSTTLAGSTSTTTTISSSTTEVIIANLQTQVRFLTVLLLVLAVSILVDHVRAANSALSEILVVAPRLYPKTEVGSAYGGRSPRLAGVVRRLLNQRDTFSVSSLSSGSSSFWPPSPLSSRPPYSSSPASPSSSLSPSSSSSSSSSSSLSGVAVTSDSQQNTAAVPASPSSSLSPSSSSSSSSSSTLSGVAVTSDSQQNTAAVSAALAVAQVKSIATWVKQHPRKVVGITLLVMALDFTNAFVFLDRLDIFLAPTRAVAGVASQLANTPRVQQALEIVVSVLRRTAAAIGTCVAQMRALGFVVP
eukprot:CAMPEP_0171983384 /NCGR_PEP_ID=MMETSP0993-20121228/273270_1 /TAXON_ID=483369 /ORGANISM="non described non described, Strain CCMP2098" /LENGTH=413 /DNA_ID=CAMNT_0012636149 /DNA_START=144 /DNA_END=1385 /DNA_ORIENTATION=+